MKRFNATWMMAAASAVLLTLPATGVAQTPQPPTTQPPATTPPAGAGAERAAEEQASAQEHLRKASAALAEVKIATLPAKAKTQVAEIKRRLTALERTSAAGDKASPTAQANRSAKAKAADNWGTEVAAIDKALTSLLGPTATTGATPTTTGTSGTAAAPNKAAEAIMLDAEAKASLNEVRTHLTAYATAMAGGKTETPAAEPAATEPSAPAAPTQPPPATTPPAGEPPSAQPPTPQPTDPTTPAQASSTQSGTDETAARRHLTEGRNTLSALTQLPAAAQLTGDARTQVAQLISNFNELITTQSQWRESYAKVSANLTSLIGPDSGTSDPVGTSGTTGAVGTSGAASASLDPAVREKLVELRTHLTAFEKAAGGSAAGTTPMAPATTVPDDTRPTAATPTTPSTPPAATTPAMEPAPRGTTGTQTPAAKADVMRHVAAMDALLKMQDDSGGLTLTKAQVEELRTHWTALRQALDKK